MNLGYEGYTETNKREPSYKELAIYVRESLFGLRPFEVQEIELLADYASRNPGIFEKKMNRDVIFRNATVEHAYRELIGRAASQGSDNIDLIEVAYDAFLLDDNGGYVPTGKELANYVLKIHGEAEAKARITSLPTKDVVFKQAQIQQAVALIFKADREPSDSLREALNNAWDKFYLTRKKVPATAD